MKKGKTIIIAVIVVIALLAASIMYYIYTKEDTSTTLNLIDKKWIESNKNKLFDIAVVNNIPVFNYKGDGIFFDFINDIEKDTLLDFNPISYNYNAEVNSEYSFKIKKNIEDKDILIFKDNYVLVSTSKNKYDNLSDVNNVTVGVLNSDLDLVSKYITSEVTFQKFETVDELFASLEPSDKNVIAVPRMVYLDRVLKTSALNIVYSMSDLNEYYVLSLGNNDKLNTIIKKYFNKWYLENYNELYKKHFNENYFTFRNVDETAKAKFKSKNYIYGFVNNPPYDLLYDNKLLGLNSLVVKDFANLVGIDLEIQKYNSINTLVEALNANKVDFIFNNYRNYEYQLDVSNTTSTYNEEIVIVSNTNNTEVVNSINSVKDKEIMVVADSKIAETLNNNGNKIKVYKNVLELLENIKSSSIIAIDYETYYYYSKTLLKDYKIDYQFKLSSEYTYLSRDISDNKIFNDYLNFYLSFINEKEYQNNAYIKVLAIKQEKYSNNLLLLLLGIISGLLLIIVLLKKLLFKKKKKRRNYSMSKAEKLRYIDVLTSLKNRNYLNDHIEEWDESEVYPQTIVIVDLNNVAYINDNYGHQEGDNVIKEAANILIKNQIENTEIIRTNGNEFLIYMVGYDEKQVSSYVKKLLKELKELAHGFGAAGGYSMIVDAIKTLDDAVNEATLDMRKNKEEAIK